MTGRVEGEPPSRQAPDGDRVTDPRSPNVILRMDPKTASQLFGRADV